MIYMYILILWKGNLVVKGKCILQNSYVYVYMIFIKKLQLGGNINDIWYNIFFSFF